MLSPLDVLRRYPQHDGTTASMLRGRVSVTPDKPFIEFRGVRRTYAEIEQDVARTAAMLSARGVGPGQRVAIMSLNHPSTVITFLALANLGAIMVPINPDFSADETGYVLAHANISGAIASPQALPTVLAACQALPAMPWIMSNQPVAPQPGLAPTPSLAQAVQACSDPAPEPRRDAKATCVFIYTSGTTGMPKGVMHSQRSLLTAGEGFVERMFLQPEDRLLCVLPMFHVNAIFYSLAGAMAAGATLILEPRFSASQFWHTVKASGATEVNTIAAAATILMRRPRSEYVPGHRLQKMYGAPFDEETYRVFQQEFAVPTLIEGYGMSEVPGALSNPFLGPHKVRSMGQPSRHPDPGVALAELRIAGDDGAFLPAGQVGELVVRTPIVMQGYFRDEAQTRAAFRDGWFLTGDLAYVDADNYFWFVARKKDIIRKRGENISGAELDRIIGNHPAVLEAAAIPVPSELGEDDIFVAVVLRPGMPLQHAQIAQWCRERLAPIKVPRYVAFVDSLPHTPTHRVAKFRLRDDATLRALAVDLEQPPQT